MKSKISFFNWGISKNLLKRYWPLWGAYFAILLLFMLAPLSSMRYWAVENKIYNLSHEILDGSPKLLGLSFFACLPVAWAMFGYLYNAKSCGMMNALPIRRESMFVTVYLTGLVPMLAADLLTMLVTAMLYGIFVPAIVLWKWFFIAALCNVTFYSIAVFCAMLTGSAVFFPVVYVVVNVAAIMAEAAVFAVPSIIAYGYSAPDFILYKLSPIFELAINFYVEDGLRAEDIVVGAYSLLWVYGVAGLLLSVASLWLYRRRSMETATDTIAVSVLKPIFKYGLCFGGAVIFAYFLYSIFYNDYTGFAAAMALLVLLLIGAFIFYFASEMLLQKSLRVFRGKWKEFIISCLILTAFTLCVELDVFGYERYVPDVSEVESVEIQQYGPGTKLKEPENIAAAAELHRLIIDQETQNENAEDTIRLYLKYNLKNGRAVSRTYDIPDYEKLLYDPSSSLYLYQKFENSPEARQNRMATTIPVTAENIQYCDLCSYYRDENGKLIDEKISLSPAEAVQLFNNCILPDVKDSSIGSYYLHGTNNFTHSESTVYLQIGLRLTDEKNQVKDEESLEITVTMDASRTVKWISEHCDITLISVDEAKAQSQAAA